MKKGNFFKVYLATTEIRIQYTHPFSTKVSCPKMRQHGFDIAPCIAWLFASVFCSHFSKISVQLSKKICYIFHIFQLTIYKNNSKFNHNLSFSQLYSYCHQLTEMPSQKNKYTEIRIHVKEQQTVLCRNYLRIHPYEKLPLLIKSSIKQTVSPRFPVISYMLTMVTQTLQNTTSSLKT